jgi:hypothetical protein
MSYPRATCGGAAREKAAIDELRKQATGYLEAKQDYEKKLQHLDAEIEKKLEGKRRELTEKEQAMKRASGEHMQEHKTWSGKWNSDMADLVKERASTREEQKEWWEQRGILTELMEARERSVTYREARAEGKDATKLQGKVRKLEHENAKLAAKLQSNKKRKRSHADQEHRRQLQTVTNTAPTASK